MIFRPSALTKVAIKMNQWEFFNSVFSYGKRRDSSLTYFLVFVVLYLKLIEKLTKCMKAHFVLLVHWNEPGDVINLVKRHK